MKGKIFLIFLVFSLLIMSPITIGADGEINNSEDNPNSELNEDNNNNNKNQENTETTNANSSSEDLNKVIDEVQKQDINDDENNESNSDKQDINDNENNESNSDKQNMEDGSNESNSTEIDLENLSSQENSVYISSNNILPPEEPKEEQTAALLVESSEKENSGPCWGYDALGKKVIKIENCEEGDIDKIKLSEELEINEFEKEVIVSSKEDFNKPIRVYSILTKEANKEEIKIFWKNENNLEITQDESFSVEYYDKNENGLIDKVSWIVPHLSEQKFKIIVEIENPKESTEELLLNVTGPSGQTRNPINFNIEVNYSGNFSCNLKIGNEEALAFSSNKNYSLDLRDGDYNWEVICYDSVDGTNSSITNATFGDFSVNEGVYYTNLTEGKLYFLDLIQNKIQNPETITINSTNPSNYTIKIKRNGQEIYVKESFNNTNILMNELILSSAGNYTLSVKFKEPSPEYEILKNFYVASANITLNATSVEEGKPVKITAIGNSQDKAISTIIIDYGDGTSDYNHINANSFSKEFVKTYNKNGNYNIKLFITIPGEDTFNIIKNGLVVTKPTTPTNPKDEKSPEIELLYPEDKEIFEVNHVNFSYKASDDVKIQNCTFKLYENCASMTTCSTSESNLAFPLNSQQKSLANNFSVQNNKEIRIDLKDFDDGIYLWEVECYDNSSNNAWERGFLKIKVNESQTSTTQNYSQKAEIDRLKEIADHFITKSFSLEEKEVLEDLILLEDTKYYKKRLLDIENFFRENYKYVSSEELRNKKTEEYLTELNEIKNKIPKEISIKENYEYVKNSVETDFEDVIKSYFDSTNTQISKSSLKKLATINRELQNDISISTKVRKVEIEYNNGTQEIILVKKKIDLNDDSHERILEIIPKEVLENSDDVFFLVDSKVIQKDPIFEIDYDDLEKGEILYYLTKKIKIKDIEKTETILFEDNLNKFERGVTGLFILEFTSIDNTIYFVLIFVLLVVLISMVFFVIKKFKMIGWKKEPNVVRVLNLIEDVKRALKEKDIERAREKYYKIKEIYPVLPSKTKPYFYEKIKEMLIRIDRKDIFGLVKEYQEAKRKWNKEEVLRLYEDIRKIYERLPEKDRKKVYGIINGY